MLPGSGSVLPGSGLLQARVPAAVPGAMLPGSGLLQASLPAAMPRSVLRRSGSVLQACVPAALL